VRVHSTIEATTTLTPTGFVGTTSETRTYDALNRITSNADNDYKVEYEYADIGFESLVYSETQSYVGMTAYPKTVTKTYDASGNRATEAYPSGANLSLDYTYNDIDNLTDISDGTNSIAAYSWIGLRKKQTTFQSGATATRHYSGFRNEIESLRHETSAPATIVRLDYGYNKVHDRTYERFGASGSSGDAFAYDKLRRLTTAWMGSADVTAPGSSAYTKKIEYNYDDDGNRSSVVVTPYGGSSTTTSYTTNNLNEYTQVGGTSRSHDANGNVTDDGTFTFEYNYKNLIVKVTRKSDSTVVGGYRYDAEGRRVEKSAGGDVERYIRSRIRMAETNLGPGGGGRYSMSHVVTVFDGSNVWQQNFVWADTPDSVEMLEQADVLDYDSDGNTTEVTRSFYHRNALGSVMEITDANEADVVSYRYDPYGNMTITRGGVTQTTDPLGQHWGFTGRFRDEESGLWYYRARYYDSDRGRFMERDPLGVSGGPVLYEYVQSSPASGADPSGLLAPGRRIAGEVVRRSPTNVKLVIVVGAASFAAGAYAGKKLKERFGDTCETRYPDYRKCADLESEYSNTSYTWNTIWRLFQKISKSARLEKKSAKSGICWGKGNHYNVRAAGKYPGSLTRCLCCRMIGDEPKLSLIFIAHIRS